MTITKSVQELLVQKLFILALSELGQKLDEHPIYMALENDLKGHVDNVSILLAAEDADTFLHLGASPDLQRAKDHTPSTSVWPTLQNFEEGFPETLAALRLQLVY